MLQPNGAWVIEARSNDVKHIHMVYTLKTINLTCFLLMIAWVYLGNGTNIFSTRSFIFFPLTIVTSNDVITLSVIVHNTNISDTINHHL